MARYPNGFDELQAAYEPDGETSYDAFLQKLEKTGPSKTINAPLTNCKILCYTYLQSKQIDTGITAAIDDIKGELVALSRSGGSSSTENFSDLKRKIKTLLTKIQSFNPNPGSSGSGSSSTQHPGSSEPGSDGLQKAGSSGTMSAFHTPSSSSAGPAVGGLLGVGALGAGVAYGLNVGGAKTLINGLLRIG
ncbi:fibrinogen alpha chain [Babesia caballi]|uniref:Fibrinogen alpha chain n=1 Tax=Babesia caballi TaxID=5871 RepID=A0AAV4LP75_BABCB|nr:fibrinogen alpha chain [Babesia caballi]